MAPMMMMLVYNINSDITNSRDSINWQIFGITQDSLVWPIDSEARTRMLDLSGEKD